MDPSSFAAVPLPKRFLHEPEEAVTPPRDWWTEFEDPELNVLVARALAGNWTLRAAGARLAAAQAVARQAAAVQWPFVSLESQTRRTRTAPSSASPLASALTVNQFALGLAASYEIDLWGRVAAGRQAARYDFLATEADLRTAEITLAAQVVETWLDIRLQTALLALFAEQTHAGAQHLELIEIRFARGQAAVADVLHQRFQLAALETLVPEASAQMAAQRHLLATLIGGAPGTVPLPDPPTSLPTPPPLPAIGIPAELLSSRPDVRAALQRLAAADRRTAAAIANRLPALRLTASFGYQAPKASDLFDNWIANLAAGLAGPLFEGGSRAAEVERTRAVAAERLAQAAATLQLALREVEDALVRETRLAEIVAGRARQLDLARQTFNETRARYLGGINDYLSVLIALNRLQDIERQYLTDQRRRLAARVQLYRALGREIGVESACSPFPEESHP